MKTRTIITVTLAILMAVPAVTPLPAAAEPQVFMGVAGENGYMVMGSDGRVHYTISNDGRPYYYYGYCRHHHRKHRCRYVPRPRHHKPKPPKHKHKKHKKDRGYKHHKKHKHHDLHHRHHDHDDDDD